MSRAPHRLLWRRPLRLLAYAALAWLVLTWSAVLLMRFVPPWTSAVMIERQIGAWIDGEKNFRLRQHWVPWDRISPWVPLAMVAGEDQKFPFHHGFDFESIHKAIAAADEGERLRGASTISQQTAKNLFLWNGRSFVRKGIEAYFTVLLELTWPKRRILEVYMNIAELGNGIYGVGAASAAYFHTTPAHLGPAQAARLAAVLPNPRVLHVDRPSAYVLRRSAWIERQMRQLGGPDYVEDMARPQRPCPARKSTNQPTDGRAAPTGSRSLRWPRAPRRSPHEFGTTGAFFTRTHKKCARTRSPPMNGSPVSPLHQPRDLIGYGANPPDAKWPNKARVAVQFVINYEEGAENCVLNGDPAAESFISEMVGTPPLQGQRHMSMEWLYEYGSRAGFWRLLRLFKEEEITATIFAVGLALEQNPAVVPAMLDAGFEIACHGWRWINYQYMGEAQEAEHIARTVETIKRLAGKRPVGWYTGRNSPNTRRLVADYGGFLYDADSYNDDLPYWELVKGKPQLIVPYTLDTNDMRYVAPQGFNSGEQYFTYMKDAFDTLYAEGETAPKMMSCGIHCRISGRPARTAALKRFIEYVKSHDGAWICTREQIARHWRKVHPYKG